MSLVNDFIALAGAVNMGRVCASAAALPRCVKFMMATRHSAVVITQFDGRLVAAEVAAVAEKITHDKKSPK